MPWYEIYGKDEAFEKFYDSNPHLYKTHEKYFNECNDEYLEFANKFHPTYFDEWRASLGKLYEYEKALYAKVDRWYNLIIFSYYSLSSKSFWDYTENKYVVPKNQLFMRFIFDTATSKMYHYRKKNFRNIAYVLNTCDGKYQMGGWTDYDKFYSQYQRKLDDKSIKILKSFYKFQYLPIEKFKKINIYNLFQVSDDTIYQYEILLKNNLSNLASDMLLSRNFITPDNFKRFKKEIMGGIRYKNLYKIINAYERKERERIEKLEKKERCELFSKLPKLKFDLGDYILRHPADVKELEQEGRELHHCVASYLDRIVAKETDVMLLRKKSEPDKPFFTIELRNNLVVQCRTFKNQTEPEITKLVENYFKNERSELNEKRTIC